MKRHTLLGLCLLVLVLIATRLPMAFAQVSDWKQIQIKPLPPFHPQEPKRIVLPNGMVVFLQEDHELPLIEGVARIRGGSRSEPAEKVGMLDLYGEAWRTGGTKDQTGDQLDDYLEIRAAKIETGSSVDSTNISLSCMKADFDDVFKVFAALLRTPEFRDDKIELAKQGAYDSIARRNDQVGTIAARESNKLGYGAQNPYAREAEYATIAAVTRQDLFNWHKDHVSPNNMILGFVGDFDSAALAAKLLDVFGAWPQGTSTKPLQIEFHPARPGYYFVSKPDVNQSNIRMVALGVQRDNPDYYAIQVFNEAFSGGFASRLFSNIRTVKGLAYSVNGSIGTAFDHPGMVRLSMSTKSGTTIEAIQALYEQIDRLAREPITEEEVKRAKDSILNSFVFNFDSPDKILRERMAYEFYGYPADFLERYQAGVEKTTAADVARAAAKYLHKDQLAVLVVGNQDQFDKPLSSLGSVNNVDITIPPSPGEKESAAAPTASNSEGKALAAKVVTAMGGAAKLQVVQSLQSDYTVTQPTPQGDMTISMQSSVVFPEHFHLAGKGPMGEFIMVATPKFAFMASGGNSQAMPEARKADMLAQLKRNFIYIGQHVDDPAFMFAATGTEKIGDAMAQVLDISSAGVPVRWYVDPQTGRVLRESYTTTGRSGPVQGESELSDWQTHDGVTLPYLRKNKQDGKESGIIQYSTIKINPAIDPKLFDQPAAAQNPQ